MTKQQSAFMQPGVLTEHLSGFAHELKSVGYTKLTVAGYSMSIAHFAEWARRRDQLESDCSADDIDRFARHRCRGPGGRQWHRVSGRYVQRVRRFIRYLEPHPMIHVLGKGRLERRLPLWKETATATKRISPHVLRHSCAMHTLQATHDVRKVSLWLGHATLQSTEIYLRADPAEKLEALAAMTAPSLKRGQFRAPDKLLALLRPASADRRSRYAQ